MSDFKAKVHKIRFPLGLRPRPRLGSLQLSPYFLAVVKRACFSAVLLRGRREKREGEGRGKVRMGKGGG